MNTDRSDGTTLLGLSGFVVLTTSESDGQLWLLVETTATDAVCPGCGARAKAKDIRRTVVRDLPASGRPVALVWRKRRWRCENAECARKTWSEESPQIAPRACLTRRARVECCRLVGEDARSVSEVAKAFGVSWGTVMGAVVEHGTPLVDDPARVGDVVALGVDETSWLAATPDHPTLFATGLVDIRRAQLVDVIDGRDAGVLRSWLADRDREWLAQVEVVCLDPFEAYRNGLKPHLAHATLVADPFHIVRLANRALDRARRRVQHEITGHRGRRGDPLYDIRKILLTGCERLSEKGWARMRSTLDRVDVNDVVVACWLAKENLREVYTVHGVDEATVLLDAVIAECDEADIPELATLAKSLRSWHAEILNHHHTGDSNGPTEAMNLVIKKIKRVGHGFTSFKNYRIRLLLHCGVKWKTSRTASMRGRSPHLVA